ILKRHAAKAIATKATIAAGAVLAPFSIIAGLPIAALGVGSLLAGNLNKIPEKYRPLAKKASIRTLLATGLYTAGALAVAPWLGAIGAGIAIAGPTAAKLSWTHRKKIGKGVKKGAKLTGKAGKGVGKLGLWGLKYTIGLPFFGPQWILGKIYKNK
ncbi:unnamed protein product, partial [marine sediment metagenome]